MRTQMLFELQPKLAVSDKNLHINILNSFSERWQVRQPKCGTVETVEKCGKCGT